MRKSSPQAPLFAQLQPKSGLHLRQFIVQTGSTARHILRCQVFRDFNSRIHLGCDLNSDSEFRFHFRQLVIHAGPATRCILVSQILCGCRTRIQLGLSHGVVQALISLRLHPLKRREGCGAGHASGGLVDLLLGLCRGSRSLDAGLPGFQTLDVLNQLVVLLPELFCVLMSDTIVRPQPDQVGLVLLLSRQKGLGVSLIAGTKSILGCVGVLGDIPLALLHQRGGVLLYRHNVRRLLLDLSKVLSQVEQYLVHHLGGVLALIQCGVDVATHDVNKTLFVLLVLLCRSRISPGR